jgi:hypothetical protein
MGGFAYNVFGTNYRHDQVQKHLAEGGFCGLDAVSNQPFHMQSLV